MKDELFKKVYIKSEDDLPKVGGNYFFGYKNPNRFDSCSYGAVHYVSSYGDHQFWMKEIDWYLQPIDSEYRNQGIPDDKKLAKAAAEIASEYDDQRGYRIAKVVFYKTINWFKQQIQSK